MANKIENLRNFTFLSNPQSNPAQSLAAFVVSNIDYENDRYINKIYTFDGTKLRPLTEAGNESNYFFEDDKNIIFSCPQKERYDKSRSEETQSERSYYYRIAVDGGEASYAFSLPLSVDKLFPLKETNKFLVLASYDVNCPDLWQKSADAQKDYAEKHQRQNRPHIINEIPFQANGHGYLYDRRSALFFYDALTDELELIGSDYQNHVINWLSLNNDKTKAIFAATAYEGDNEYRWQPFAKLYELDITTQIINPLYTKLDQQLGDGFYLNTINSNGETTNNEQIIVISSDTKDYGINQNNHFYLYDRQQKTFHKLSDYEIEYGCSVGNDVTYGHNEAYYKSSSSTYNLIETKGNSTQLSAFTLIESHTQSYPTLRQEIILNKSGACLAAFTLNKKASDIIAANSNVTHNVSRETLGDNLADTSNATDTANCDTAKSMFVLGLYEQQLSELYLVNNKELYRLSYFNDQDDLDLTTCPLEKLNFTSPYDKASIEGFILLPPTFQRGQKAHYPLILDIHGGPKTVYGSTYYHEMQVWASLGFIVCFTNPHGSDGRGNAFADIRGAYGERDYDDLMTFVDEVINAYPEVDKERLGVTGGSYGGFMTNWIITHTKRFKVACSQRSISNWLSFYGTSDIGYYFATDQNGVQNFTLPEQEILWQHSPLKYINNATTPTLFIHSDADYRCPLEQGMQMHTALRAIGVTSKLCIFPGENHELSRGGKPQAREWRLNLITHWFLKYLKADQKELIEQFQEKID